MPFPLFDRSKLQVLPFHERKSDIDIGVMIGLQDELRPFSHPALPLLAEDLVAAKRRGAASILMYGGHVIRSGCGPHMIALMREGLLTHLATNGAGSIHDYELARFGATCESVARYISLGQFGLWRETGEMNDIINAGVRDNLGIGEAIGRYIWEEKLPHRESSVLGMAYHLGVPVTVHVGIGCDIIHEHPNCNGAALGQASYTDFLVYTQSVCNLEGGVFMNFGSAVTGPEVFLKALAMARNVAKQQGKQIIHITNGVFDIQPLGDGPVDEAPPKDNPRYYFRPWKTILARSVADGGRSYYVQGEHRDTLPHLARIALNLERETR